MELRHSTRPGPLPGTLQPFAFVETGAGKINVAPFADGANRRHLSAAGAGARWGRGRDFLLRLTPATRLGSAPSTADTDRHTRAWIEAVKYF